VRSCFRASLASSLGAAILRAAQNRTRPPAKRLCREHPAISNDTAYNNTPPARSPGTGGAKSTARRPQRPAVYFCQVRSCDDAPQLLAPLCLLISISRRFFSEPIISICVCRLTGLTPAVCRTRSRPQLFVTTSRLLPSSYRARSMSHGQARSCKRHGGTAAQILDATYPRPMFNPCRLVNSEMTCPGFLKLCAAAAALLLAQPATAALQPETDGDWKPSTGGAIRRGLMTRSWGS